MKKIAVMQPTYLPWYGYFGLIDYVDEFIFLNNVQFEKRSWQSRNLIKSNEKKLMLSIGVSSKGKFFQNLDQVLILQESKNKKKHLKAIELNYKKTKYFNDYFPLLSNIYNHDYKYLKDFNIAIINLVCGILDIKTKITHSNDIRLNFDSKVDRLVKICKYLDAESYISPEGSKNYLNDTKLFEINKINLKYFNMKSFTYNQLGKNFISNLSIIDLIFNEGPKALKIIRKNIVIF